jgi:hypothetical protein
VSNTITEYDSATYSFQRFVALLTSAAGKPTVESFMQFTTVDVTYNNVRELVLPAIEEAAAATSHLVEHVLRSAII